MSQLFEATALVVPFEQLRMTDVESVGGKNASLGEMISQLPQGVRVPTGFATTAHAFRQFLAHDGLADKISAKLAALDVEDVRALAQVGAEIRALVENQPFPADLEQAIREEFVRLQGGNEAASFAVRSSATAEDLPDASFAGQQETFLNVVGIESVLHKMKEVFASLYNDRAISYRVHKGFAHDVVALSAGVQRMVRSDLGAAGVMFTIDTESGFEDVVFITSSYGLGETVVQGAVNPDEFYVHKPMLKAGKKALIRRNLGSKLIQMVFASPEEKAASGKLVKTTDVAHELRNRYSLSDEDVQQLAHYALVIEQHYGRPMDIEWGKDGTDGQLYILQARPETVKSQAKGQAEQRYALKGTGNVLAEGRAIGQKIGTGPVRLVNDIANMDQVQPGDVLVTDMTDPNWEPVMKRASAIVTNRGGRTCHAAIIARELGIPAVVGCGNATDLLKDGTLVTVSCAEGDTGKIYDGLIETEVTEVQRGEMPAIKTKIIGGSRYEPEEENPMLGFRGAARYISEDFGEAFRMECEALRRVREDMGLTNVQIMIPFVRTLKQAERVTQLLAANGLKRGDNELKLIMMCEVPSNAILADEFLEFFDGFSIGSNDLTQLTLGLDRDSGLELLAADFDERDPAVRKMLSRAIKACLDQGKYVGICGQGPSDHPDFAQWLADEGIVSISLNPDSVVATWQRLAQ